jgi:hypothetical protein
MAERNQCTSSTGVHLLAIDPEVGTCAECSRPIPAKLLPARRRFAETEDGTWNRAGRVALQRKPVYTPDLSPEAKPLDPIQVAILTEAQRRAEEAFRSAQPEIAPRSDFAALVPTPRRAHEPGEERAIDDWDDFDSTPAPIDFAKRRAGDTE